jgi:pyruvate formate lyase activating enzyme
MVRENRNGHLWSLVYGRPVARHVDFIEKKPLYHVFPGSLSYSYGTAGCNFHCTFCQNADIAHPNKIMRATEVQDVPPKEIVSESIEHECLSIAATYTEPTVFMEYVLDVARLGRQNRLVQILVTNGFMTPRALNSVIPFLDAANVDLKSFRGDFYTQQCAARLHPVLQTLRSLKNAGVWLEVTTLIIPGVNDSRDELKEMADFIASLGRETPWHLLAFHPSYLLTDRPPTSMEILYRAREIGILSGLRYVYLENVDQAEYKHTYCHQCGEKLIDRSSLTSVPVGLHNGNCAHCGQVLPGLGMKWSEPS